MKSKLTIIAFICAIAFGCIEEYNAPIAFDSGDVLVVDGYLDASTRSIQLKLSYVFDPARDTITTSESGATVMLEDDSGVSIQLTEEKPGQYFASAIDVAFDKKYRLHFFTSGGEEYESGFVSVTRTPEIDSVTWKHHAIEEGVDGVQIVVNSSAATETGLNYFWDYEETWEYTASFFSEFKYVNREPVYRAHDERIFTCYRTVPSSSILIGTTKNLSVDVIQNHPLLWIPGESERLAKKYSILVRQRTITSEAYDYWTKIKRTTEDLGGLFDPPLTQVQGNIRNITRPGASVVGFFGAGEVSAKRLTFAFADLPDVLRIIRHPPMCGSDALFPIPLSEVSKLSGAQLIVSARYVGATLVGYFISSPMCTDCRVHGGVLTPPDFWNE